MFSILLLQKYLVDYDHDHQRNHKEPALESTENRATMWKYFGVYAKTAYCLLFYSVCIRISNGLPINNSKYADDVVIKAESIEELQPLLNSSVANASKEIVISRTQHGNDQLELTEKQIERVRNATVAQNNIIS